MWPVGKTSRQRQAGAARLTVRGRVRVFATTTYLLVALALAAAAVSYAVDTADLRRLGAATSGSIVDFTWTGRFALIKDGYVVSYTPAGASAPLRAEVSDDDADLAIGDAFPLLYNPLEPTDVVSAEAGPDDGMAWLTAVLAMVAIIGAIAAALGRLPRFWGGTLIRDHESPPGI